MMISNIYLSTQVIIAKIMHGSLNYIISWNHSYVKLSGSREHYYMAYLHNSDK